MSLAAWSQPERPPSVERSLELRDEVAHLLSVLPADQREIVLLHRYEGFSYAEIAGMTGTTEAAAKQKAYRALLALRTAAER